MACIFRRVHKMRMILLVFAASSCAMAAQISASQTADLTFTLQGNVGSLSIVTIPNGSVTLPNPTIAGVPTEVISVGPAQLTYTATAHTNAVGDLLHESLDLTSDITAITAIDGTLMVTVDPDFNFDSAIAGPSLASISVLLALEQFDPLTSQWNALNDIKINENSNTASPSTIHCTDCVHTEIVTIANSTAEFRLHSQLDFTIEQDPSTPEPGTFALLAVPLCAAMLVRRLRSRH